MTGNQDKPRLMAMATGEVRFDEDSKLAGWTRDIELQNTQGFSKSAMMHAINLFIPGVPCIYYGDEIGMTGGNDPDNRRMMRFENISEEEKQLRNEVTKLIKARTKNMALMYGDFNIIEAKGDRFVASRNYLNNEIYLFVNNSRLATTFQLPTISDHGYTTLAGRGVLSLPSVEIEPLSYMLLKVNTSK